MAYNGSGTFERPVSDYVFDTVISETDMNTEMDGIATGLSNCITKDGQTTITANIDFNSKKITSLANATARTDAANLGKVQDGMVNWIDGGGTADAITATYSPAVTAVSDGQEFFVRATAANTSTTPTFSPNGLGPYTITKNGAQALAAGDIPRDSYECHFRYRSSDTKMELLNPSISTSGFLSNVVEDTTPQLGGNLDVNSHGIAFTGATVTDVTGTDTKLCSGTAGTSGNLASWNVDGDLVDSGVAAASPSAWLHSTSAATTSGTAAAFSSLPAGLTEIVLTFSGVSQDSANQILALQIGDSGGLESSGYGGSVLMVSTAGGSNSVTANSTYFGLTDNTGFDAATVIDGTVTLRHLGSNQWSIAGALSADVALFGFFPSGQKTLSGTLDRVSIITAASTAIFDAGTIYLNAR